MLTVAKLNIAVFINRAFQTHLIQTIMYKLSVVVVCAVCLWLECDLSQKLQNIYFILTIYAINIVPL